MGADSIFADHPHPPPRVHDYYVLTKHGGEAQGVIAKKDFNKRVFIFYTGEGLRITSWNSVNNYGCKPITQAEYETYIEFGIIDFGEKTTWKKWVKSWLKMIQSTGS